MRRGFTLIEVLVVLVIMATSLAVAAPALRPLLVHDEVSAATELSSVLRAAARTARERARPVTVVLDSMSGRYWIDAAGDTLIAGRFTADGPHVVLGSARVRISFLPDGRSTGTVLAVSESSHGGRLEIDERTGAVEFTQQASGLRSRKTKRSDHAQVHVRRTRSIRPAARRRSSAERPRRSDGRTAGGDRQPEAVRAVA